MTKSKTCKQCGSHWVVNRTYSLCQYHNNIRIHGTAYPKKEKVNQNNLFRQSKRNEKGLLICVGCGRAAKHHDVAHLIPVSIEKKLENVDANREILCRGCHEVWEHKKPGVEQLNCYQDFLIRVKELNELYYNRNLK